jgi:hypothetical protein
MTKNKQQTEVDVAELAMKLYPFSNSERNAFITGYNKAKEMEKERIIDAHYEGQCNQTEGYPLQIAEQYYNKTYGGNK